MPLEFDILAHDHSFESKATTIDVTVFVKTTTLPNSDSKDNGECSGGDQLKVGCLVSCRR